MFDQPCTPGLKEQQGTGQRMQGRSLQHCSYVTVETSTHREWLPHGAYSVTVADVNGLEPVHPHHGWTRGRVLGRVGSEPQRILTAWYLYQALQPTEQYWIMFIDTHM